MLPRDRAKWALVVAICVALLMAPALWNGFALLQYDTGGYLARWYEGYLVPSRAVAYGLMLAASGGMNFWPVLLLQSALAVWVIHLVLRAHGYGRPLVLLGVIAALSIATTLPWLTSILLTDIFCGLGVLALYLVVLRPQALNAAERCGLIALIAVSAATHSATLAVLLCVLAALLAGVLVSTTVSRRLALPPLRDGAIALALGAGLVFSANFAVSGTLSWTPGGLALSFGRMLQDGIVDRYLADHCSERKLILCEHRAELPRDADAFFWGGPLFNRLGRFAVLNNEMASIALESLTDYPLLQIKSAVIDTAEQLIDVHSGEGVVNSIWHTYGVMERYTPWAIPAMRAAHQQTAAKMPFKKINRLHYPLALLALAFLPAMLLIRGEQTAKARELAAVVLLAVLANAAVCGILSNPHDRYGARVVWLASFAALVFILERTRPRKYA